MDRKQRDQYRRRSAKPIQVSGVNFFPKGRHKDGTRAFCASRERGNNPPDYDVSTNDPWNKLRRIFWIFLTLVAAIGLAKL